MAIIKKGSKAFFDTFSGSIPCVVLGITGNDGPAASSQEVTFELTDTRGAYKKGEILTRSALWVFPRECRHQHAGCATIGFYMVECDSPAERKVA